jgi:oligogalacturonide transport system ATP-binding protein
VDTPTSLYNRPANAFVASFIGSPEMNLIKTSLHQTGDQIKVQLGTTQLALPATHTARLANNKAEGVIFGIRPEHIHFHARAQGDSLPIDTTYRFMEHMGAEIFLYVSVGDTPLTVRMPAEEAEALASLERGAPVQLHIQMSACHLFDGQSELSLLQP